MKIFEITFCGTWFLCVCLGQTFGAPANWNSPCGSSHSFIYEALIEDATRFTRAATNLKTNYTNGDRVKVNGWMIQSLQSSDILGLNLPQNITDKTPDFSRDYENLSRVKIYLDQVLFDEINSDREYDLSMKKMIGTIDIILNDIRLAMKMDVNSTSVPSTAKDVLPEVMKLPMERANRFMRDYVIFHQAENYGKLLNQQYRKLCETQRT